ncbi:MAG: hypothetical protein JNL64_02075 [Blastocatellia bacterium]|nr:hypothetical protein [Blastocatellia bacterium]
MKRILTAVFFAAVMTVAALAQYAPNDVSDLIGVRASSGENSLRNRGYSYVKGNKNNNRSYTYWWNGGRSACILVTTYDGRYESIVGTNSSECGQNNNGGGWNNGGWNGSKQRPPSWARGTFYGTAPNGTQIQLTISNDGSVSANIGGSMSYGGYNNGYLYINGNSSRLERDGSGFQTVSNTDGERIYYSKNSWGSGGNNGGGWGGNQGSRPPSWANGTFYGTAPNGTQIQLSITDNGSVTATIGGSPNYGTYSNGNLIINGQTSRLERSGDGFVTVSNANGERIYYSRSTWGGGGGGNSGNNEPQININDLIGFRSAAGDREARNRGFKIVDTTVDGNRMLKTMWRERSKQCLQVTVVDDQYLHIYDIQSHRKCK